MLKHALVASPDKRAPKACRAERTTALVACPNTRAPTARRAEKTEQGSDLASAGV